MLFRSKCQNQGWVPGRAADEAFFAGACHIYFTNHTLTGKPDAFPFQESESGLGARVGLLVKLFFAGRLPTLFHQSHFDWEQSSPTPKWCFSWTCS
jgi:hypothetical protein